MQALYICSMSNPKDMLDMLKANADKFSTLYTCDDGQVLFGVDNGKVQGILAGIGIAILTSNNSKIDAIHEEVMLTVLDYKETPLTEGNPVKIVQWPFIFKDVMYKANDFANDMWRHIQFEEKKYHTELPRPIYMYIRSAVENNISYPDKSDGFHFHLGASHLKAPKLEKVPIRFGSDGIEIGTVPYLEQAAKGTRLRSIILDVEYGSINDNYLMLGCIPMQNRDIFIKYMLTSAIQYTFDPAAYEAALEAEEQEKIEKDRQKFIEELNTSAKNSVNLIDASVKENKKLVDKAMEAYAQAVNMLQQQERTLYIVKNESGKLAERWAKIFDELSKLTTVSKFTVDKDELIVVTTRVKSYDPYEKKHRDLGCLQLRLPLSAMLFDNITKDKTKSLVLIKSLTHPSYPLPHDMGGGSMCWGTGLTPLMELMRMGEIGATISFVINFFETGVNASDHAGSPVSKFPIWKD